MAASVIAMVVAMPVALGLWAARLWPGVGAGAGVGIVAGAVLIACLGREPAVWVLANAAAGLPVIAAVIFMRLRVMPVGSLRIATVSGFSPGAQLRLLVMPLMLPAALIGGLGVFLCVAAELYLSR